MTGRIEEGNLHGLRGRPQWRWLTSKPLLSYLEVLMEVVQVQQRSTVCVHLHAIQVHSDADIIGPSIYG